MTTFIRQNRKRRGTVLPIVTICLVGLIGFLALAIDIGMMAVARSQAQNAADIAALAGARTLDGKNVNNNQAAAVVMAETAATSNAILNTNITASQVTTTDVGIYRYSNSAKRFQAVFGETPGANEAYGVMQVVISTQQPTYFARIFGVQSLNIGARATAVHRPRDVSIVLDFSNSMGYSSNFNYPNNGTIIGSLNPDTRFPKFGPWVVNQSTMHKTTAYVDGNGYLFAPNNFTQDTPAGPAIVDQFVESDNSTKAFVNSVTPAPDTWENQNATGFNGDKFPIGSGQTVSGTTAPTRSQYAHTVWRLYNASGSPTDTTRHANFERNGYDWDFATGAVKSNAPTFKGYTMGPGYYGKTFYMWPPDPRLSNDWRAKFFRRGNGANWVIPDNSAFFDTTTKTWRAAGSTTYTINYDAILNWIKNTGPQTLPSSLRCGRVVYYDSIPTTIPSTGGTPDQRFWRDYINFVLANGSYSNDRNYLYGANPDSDNSYNTSKITAQSTLISSATAKTISAATNATPIVVTSTSHGLATGDRVIISGATGNTAANGTWVVTQINANSFSLNGSNGNGSYSANSGNFKVIPYLRYDDSPVHPRLHFWFGPLTMLGYIQNGAGVTSGSWLPGNVYEAQCWQLKAGINSAIKDIKNNHPNDLAAIMFFSGLQEYTTARVKMGKDYTRMQNCLFYPFSLLDSLGDPNATVRPYSNNFSDISVDIPASRSSTSPETGFKVAYNQFGTNKGGRKTASKLVIFETDGIPNTMCTSNLNAVGEGLEHTNMTVGANIGESNNLDHGPKNSARAVVRQICALDTDSPPGFSTSRNPARVHAIAFGDLFETYSTSPKKGPALRFLCAVQIDGKTSPKPNGSWDNDSLDYNANYLDIEPYKLIIGDYNTRIEKIRQALERIMQGGIQVALIQ